MSLTKKSPVGQDYPPLGYSSHVVACIFGHVARLDSSVPARDALECAYARRTEIRPPSMLEKTTRTSKADLAAPDW